MALYPASPVLVPRLLPISHSWPGGPSPRVPSSNEGVYLADLRSTQAVSHMKGLLGAIWGQARLHERGLGCTSIAVTHETCYIPWELSLIHI